MHEGESAFAQLRADDDPHEEFENRIPEALNRRAAERRRRQGVESSVLCDGSQ